MRDDTIAALPWALAGAILLLSHCDADAQTRETDALLLARVCVSEAGWTCWESGDGYAIHYAQAARAARDGVSWRSAARALSPRATGARPTTDARIAWVAGLRADGLAPAAWPARPHSPWAQYRARWLDVLERAREVVTWGVEVHAEHSPCDEPPTTWAAPWHPPSRGLRALDCGDTRNRFYTGAR